MDQNSIFNKKWAGKVCAFFHVERYVSEICNSSIAHISRYYTSISLCLASPDLDELGPFIFYWCIQSCPGLWNSPGLMKDVFPHTYILFAQVPCGTSNTEPGTSAHLFFNCPPLINLKPYHSLRLNSHEPSHMVSGSVHK